MELVDPVFGHTGINSLVYRMFHHQTLSIIFEEGNFIVKKSICWLQLIVILEERKTICSDFIKFLWVLLRKKLCLVNWRVTDSFNLAQETNHLNVFSWQLGWFINLLIQKLFAKNITGIHSTTYCRKTAQMAQILVITPWTKWWWALACLWRYSWGWNTSHLPPQQLCGHLLACWH